MPTKFTGAVSKLLYTNTLRKNCLQSFVNEMGFAWEYVPVLEHIKRFPGCLQVDISQKLKVTAAAVTQSTKKLESMGLIEKRFDPDNLRIKRMYITDKGIEKLNHGTEIFDKVDGIMFKDFSDEELKEISRLLDKINNNISSYKSGNIDEKHLPWDLK